VTCRDFATFIGDYLTGELAEDTRRFLDDHLQVCENCRRYLTSYVETMKLGQRAFDDESAALPADIPEELVQAVLSARRGLFKP
jgi:predicted anti-sigma-YlaC factor YlaD